jgi:hypothetical protein
MTTTFSESEREAVINSVYHSQRLAGVPVTRGQVARLLDEMEGQPTGMMVGHYPLDSRGRTCAVPGDEEVWTEAEAARAEVRAAHFRALLSDEDGESR